MSFLAFPHPEHGYALEVEYEVHGAIRGLRGNFGEPETPDEPDTIEILAVRNEHGDAVECDYEAIILNAIERELNSFAI